MSNVTFGDFRRNCDKTQADQPAFFVGLRQIEFACLFAIL